MFFRWIQFLNGFKYIRCSHSHHQLIFDDFIIERLFVISKYQQLTLTKPNKKTSTKPKKVSYSIHLSFLSQQPFHIIQKLLGAAIVGSLAGDGDIVGMTLEHTRIGDAHELGVVQSPDVGGSAITHT